MGEKNNFSFQFFSGPPPLLGSGVIRAFTTILYLPCCIWVGSNICQIMLMV